MQKIRWKWSVSQSEAVDIVTVIVGTVILSVIVGTVILIVIVGTVILTVIVGTVILIVSSRDVGAKAKCLLCCKFRIGITLSCSDLSDTASFISAIVICVTASFQL